MTNKEYSEMIGLRIRERMNANGLSVGYVAKALNKQPSYVSNILNGKQGTSLEILESIGNVIGFQIWEILKSSKDTTSLDGKTIVIDGKEYILVEKNQE